MEDEVPNCGRYLAINLVQLMRRARQGVDAILPGGYASAQWSDEEVVDLANEAYENMQRDFRLVHRKWGLVTLNTSSAAFTREGETYTPSTSLVVSTSAAKVTLPPDFAEMVRITCTSDRTIRFYPATLEMDHWIDTEQSGYTDQTTPASTLPTGLTFYYDIIASRTLFVTPPTSGTFNLEIDYIPMKRPLYYTKTGTVALTNAAATITGTGTLFSTDNIFTEDTNQSAEIIVGVSDPQANTIRVDKDYPRVATLTSDTVGTLKSNWGGTTTTVAPFIMAMAPTLDREYHRWMSRLISSLMLSKVNPDISEKYFSKFLKEFREQISSTIRRRQSQNSAVVEDADEFGLSGI